ncbi:MAG: hypothetical protein H6734_17530 [Alphaproteobacteria bacterium]|nr:hypothetical protein [Alphaproteobacteria bacterium]
MKRLVLLAAVLAANTACVTKLRNITAMSTTDQGVYVGYWEGTCKPVLGCDVGDGKVQFCKLDPASNALSCTEQGAITPLLDRKAQLP